MAFSAIGGITTEITVSGIDYIVHTFIENDTFEVTSGSAEVEYLITAGGGGGGYNRGGGAGAGGVLTGQKSVSVDGYSITVGAGGAGSTSASLQGNDGSNSVFDDITSFGGGGGGTGAAALSLPGKDGGSGGGGGHNPVGSRPGGEGTVGQGYDGGDADTTNGGGGGGAGEIGETATGAGGDGGDGLSSSISGILTYYGGGGGGGGYSGVGGSGGQGGGGAGATNGVSAATVGSANTGGGGGGGTDSSRNGASGGSGIVIIRYISVVATSFTFSDSLPVHLSTVYGISQTLQLTTTVSGEQGSYIYDATFYDATTSGIIGSTISGINSGNYVSTVMQTSIATDYSWYLLVTSSGEEDISSVYTFTNKFLCAGTVKEGETALSGISIRLYKRDTGELVGSGISTGISGTFEIETTYNECHYAVALYASTVSGVDITETNALIYDHLKPGE